MLYLFDSFRDYIHLSEAHLQSRSKRVMEMLLPLSRSLEYHLHTVHTYSPAMYITTISQEALWNAGGSTCHPGSLPQFPPLDASYSCGSEIWHRLLEKLLE